MRCVCSANPGLHFAALTTYSNLYLFLADLSLIDACWATCYLAQGGASFNHEHTPSGLACITLDQENDIGLKQVCWVWHPHKLPDRRRPCRLPACSCDSLATNQAAKG
jgi:hypothetical protein